MLSDGGGGPEKLVHVYMGEPFEILALTAVTARGVLSLAHLMFPRAPLTPPLAPIGVITLDDAYFRVIFQKFVGFGAGAVQVDKQPMCPCVQVIGRKIQDLGRRGLDRADKPPCVGWRSHQQEGRFL